MRMSIARKTQGDDPQDPGRVRSACDFEQASCIARSVPASPKL
jgi:hypothetical protein